MRFKKYIFIILFIFFFNPPISYAEDGYAWTELSSFSKQWNSIDVSSDGNIVIAAEYQNTPPPLGFVGPGDIYISTDEGNTWNISNQGVKRQKWNFTKMSSDGMYMYAIGLSAPNMINSSTTGSFWSTSTSAGEQGWTSVAISDSGQRLIATSDSPAFPGQQDDGFIYYSTDGGINWATSTSAGNKKWKSVTASQDAMHALAYVTSGHIYYSTDGGINWATSTSAGSKSWNSISISGNGSNAIASATNTYIYLSTDGGINWATSTSAGSRNWRDVKISSDGSTMVGIVTNGYMYVSRDGGESWVQQTSAGSRNWRSVSMSENGSIIFASVFTGKIYKAVFNDQLPQLIDLTETSDSYTYTLSFNTNQNASTTLTFELISGIGTSTQISAGTDHDFNINNLVSCTTYKYNLMVTNSFFKTSTTSSSFTTSCPADTLPVSSIQKNINTLTGGVLSLNNFNLNIPASYASSSASFQITKLNSIDSIINSYGLPDNTKIPINNYAYSLSALVNSTTSINEFNKPINISFIYDISNEIDQSSLSIYRNDTTGWTKLNCAVNTNTKFITCETDHFSLFVLFGKEIQKRSNTFGYRKINTTSQTIYKDQSSENVIDNESSTSKSIYSIDINLELGMNNEKVINLQKFLNEQGFIIAQNGPGSIGNETSYFGTLTQKALIEFQIANNILPAIGFFGPLTRNYIKQTMTFENAPTLIKENNYEIPKDNLFLGSSGLSVESLQKFLVKKNYLQIPKNTNYGYFGPLTQKALIEFQIDNNINPAMGYYGQITRNTILSSNTQ
jgi:peptidoglycan hydrolase-like protein with peptidoglycan-binding domain